MPSRDFVQRAPPNILLWRSSGRNGEGRSTSGRPARLTLALPAADHALPAEVVATLGDHNPLARVGTVAEADDDPVARQPKTIGQRGRREGGAKGPLAASRLQDGDLARKV